jgi:hypothetical protein
LPYSTIGVPGQRAKGPKVEFSNWNVGFEHSLKVSRCSSRCCSVGKHQGLEDDSWFDWECVEERGDMGELEECYHLEIVLFRYQAK